MQGLETSPPRKPSYSTWVDMIQDPHSSTVLQTHCHHSWQNTVSNVVLEAQGFSGP